MNTFWDQRYAVPGFKYGTDPNEFLRSREPGFLRAARVLVPGDGEGRNGVWLAQQGHTVVTVDSSAVGVGKARALAASRGVSIEALCADLADWQPSGGFDALVVCFLHLPAPLRRAVLRRLAGALTVGGLVVVESFHPRQLGRPSGGPQQVELLQTLADLRADFAGLVDEVLGAEVETVLAEGEGHCGPACVTRFVGRRH